MNRHHLDGNAIAADAHYGRDEPEMRECPICEGWGIYESGAGCPICHGSGEVPVEQEEPEAQERDE